MKTKKQGRSLSGAMETILELLITHFVLLDRMIATTHENTHKHCINFVFSHTTSYVKVTCTAFDNMWHIYR